MRQGRQGRRGVASMHDDGPVFVPKVRRLHVGHELRESGHEHDAAMVVRRLRPWARDAALGLDAGTSPAPGWGGGGS